MLTFAFFLAGAFFAGHFLAGDFGVVVLGEGCVLTGLLGAVDNNHGNICVPDTLTKLVKYTNV